MGVAALVFWPGGQHVGLELLLAPPGRSLQVVVLERVTVAEKTWRGPLPPMPGRVERYDSVYVRNGVASLFLAFEPLASWRDVKVTETRKRGDWAHFNMRT